MQFVIFCHSMLSEWQNGSAPFLRGIASELTRRGHGVKVLEPADSSSVAGLLADEGPRRLEGFFAAYPGLLPQRYTREHLDLESALTSVDIVLVHEWTHPQLVARIGQHRRRVGSYRLLFHDTGHRLLADPRSPLVHDLSAFDGVLAGGKVLRDFHVATGSARLAWTWNEAADTRVFQPAPCPEPPSGDVVSVADWGNAERVQEIRELFARPVGELGLTARMYGSGYPVEGRLLLSRSEISYGGFLPSIALPNIAVRYKTAVQLSGVRRMPPSGLFAALACGIPVVASAWEDEGGLLTPGRDYLVARDGSEMKQHLRALMSEPALRAELARNGLETVRARHTCAHRVDELLEISGELASGARQAA
jgi:spore maturation protein CgeB